MNKLLEDYSKKPIVPIGKVNGVMDTEINEEFSSTDDEQEDIREYERDFVEEEMKRYAQCSSQSESVRFFG